MLNVIVQFYNNEVTKHIWTIIIINTHFYLKY